MIIEALSDVSEKYDAVFCDLWGVLHNGREVFPAAVSALQAFRAKGGTVVLLTNAPRPKGGVIDQLGQLGAPLDSYDLVVTSGDASQRAIAAGLYGNKIFHIGPERDLPFFNDFNGEALKVERVTMDKADSIICTGLWDDSSETPDDYRQLILDGVNRKLKMLCANPDIEVDRGNSRIYCGGAIAKAYSEAGGESHYYGKPHAPIYQLSRQLLVDHRGEAVEDSRILAVGDGILTDVPGAIGEGLDCLFVSGGLAAEQTGTLEGRPDPEKLTDYLGEAQLSPTYTIGHLR